MRQVTAFSCLTFTGRVRDDRLGFQFLIFWQLRKLVLLAAKDTNFSRDAPLFSYQRDFVLSQRGETQLSVFDESISLTGVCDPLEYGFVLDSSTELQLFGEKL